ncbi:hypothetical protein ACHAW5_008800 [Stephanodiscus triporus]|uniref:Plastocyanin-like domain-containing protein n=1 Tax=Stephanodiscus triporus TaxID=2934178 RepID=A0ABD3PBE1_9STRA
MAETSVVSTSLPAVGDYILGSSDTETVDSDVACTAEIDQLAESGNWAGAVAVAARYDVKEADEKLRRPLRRPRKMALKLPWLMERKVPMHSRGFVRTTRHAITPARFLLLVALAHVVMGQMPQFQWGNSSCPSSYDYCATLEFCSGTATAYGFRIPGTTTSCNFRTAPLIRMVPGKKYALTLSNSLAGTGDDTSTNLHTHGLHVSGDGNSDDTTRRVTAGGCLVYTYNIRADHMGGTFWYHAHPHGRTNAQVRGGAMGMLIIEDPANLTDDPGVNKWLRRSNERLLLASRVDGSTGTAVYRGNGASTPMLQSLIANEWYRLRVVTVYPDSGPGSLEVGGAGCEVRPVAYDGVWRTVIPHPARGNVYTDLTGASRIDLAIKCAPGIHRIIWFGGQVASLNATNGNTTGATPYKNFNETWSPPRPAYLQDLRQTTMNNSYEVRVSPTAINDVSWNMDEALTTMQYNTVQEWDIDAFLDVHNFHLHVYHMQVSQCDVRAHSSHPSFCFHEVIVTTTCRWCLLAAAVVTRRASSTT